MEKISFIAAACLCGSLYAADNLASAFQEGRMDGRLRAQYFSTDWDDNTATGKNGPDAHGLAVGGSLIYHTAPLGGFSAAAGLYTTQNPGGWTEARDGATANTSKDLFARGPGSTYNYGEGYAVLAQAYLQYDIAKSTLKAGRMLMSNPWIDPNDSKMIPIAIEGFEALSSDLPGTTVQIDYANKIKERGMDYFGNMADTADTPDKIKEYYTTHYGSGTHGEAPGVTVAGIKNRSISGLELQGWIMHWPDLVDHYMVEANYKVTAGEAGLGFGGRYLKQQDKGAGDIILPSANNGDDDNSIDSYLVAFRVMMNYSAAKLTLATSYTSGDGDIIAPWRGFPTSGYTRSMTQTDWNANTRSYKGQFDYDCNAYVAGLSTMLSYSRYDRDPGKIPYQSMTDRLYGNAETRQWNLDIVYKLAGSWKGGELKARLMDQENAIDNTKADGTSMVDTSNREMRLEMNYFF